MGFLTRLLMRLQNRPATERRILGLATYGALTMVVIAAWMSSFSLSLTELPLLNSAETENAIRPRSDTETEMLPPTLSRLITPFQTLKEISKQTMQGLQEFKRQLETITRTPRITSQPEQDRSAFPAQTSEVSKNDRGKDTIAVSKPQYPRHAPETIALAPIVSERSASSPAFAALAELARSPVLLTATIQSDSTAKRIWNTLWNIATLLVK